MSQGGIILPLAIWNNETPTIYCTTVKVLNKCQLVVTGTEQGQLITWRISTTLEIYPELILLGHRGPVICIEQAGVGNEASRIVSATSIGELYLWDSCDGRLIERSITRSSHEQIHMHAIDQANVRLFCCGQYPEIQILNARSLQIVQLLACRIEPDWIRCIHLLKSIKQQTIILGVTNSGMAKVWTLAESHPENADLPIYEDESKQVRCQGARALSFCHLNPRTAMLVSPQHWQIFDASDFSLLCSVQAPYNQVWLGGVFTNIDKVAVFCSDGNAYLYQLPRSISSDNKGAGPIMEALIYCVLNTGDTDSELILDNNFAFAYSEQGPTLGTRQSQSTMGPVIIRADQNGHLSLWELPLVSDKTIASLQQETFDKSPHSLPTKTASMAEAWNQLQSRPMSILDALGDHDITGQITCTSFVSSRGRLLLGLSDGSVLIISTSHLLMHHLLESDPNERVPFRHLVGHGGAVTCLLYPHEEHARYDPSHLLSGGADFSVCLWDLNSGLLLHRYTQQCGEIQQLLVPPPSCSPRVLQCFCSVAADHSVALLGLKDFKCILLASRHLFPVENLYWRPLDDFLLVQCQDGLVHVWQMETGSIDRVLSGVSAHEVIQSCLDLKLSEQEDDQQAFASSATQMLRALKHKNIAAVKRIAAGQASEAGAVRDDDDSNAKPLDVQGLRLAKTDFDSHLILFNVEALILELLYDEYGDGSAGLSDTQPSGDQSPFLSGFLSRVRDRAGEVGQKLQDSVLRPNAAVPGGEQSGKARVLDSNYSSQFQPKLHRGSITNADGSKTLALVGEYCGDASMDLAQLLLSLLHSWSFDSDLDRMCVSLLGLKRPKRPICFGLVSKDGAISLTLPTFAKCHYKDDWSPADQYDYFSQSVRWAFSNTMSTLHLLSVISVTRVLMQLTIGAFTIQCNKRRKQIRQGSRLSSAEMDAENSKIKEAWSLLAALHCVMLPEKLTSLGKFKPALIDLLARRWQERCFEVREAAQALLLRELSRIGPKGRRNLIEEWSPFLPSLMDASLSIFGEHMICNQTGANASRSATETDVATILADSLSQSSERSDITGLVRSVKEVRRNQATAVVLIGVLGSEFPTELSSFSGQSSNDQTLARAAGQSLLELILHPPTALLPTHSSLRRAAVDLIGRGFVVWELHVDISKTILGLLDLCCTRDNVLPKESVHLPLSPPADNCRTARHSLALIASARPQAFLITLHKEITRYNQQAHQQVANVTGSILPRSKKEILALLEKLSEKHYSDMLELILPVGEILVFCLDSILLKHRTLVDIFPAASRFPMIHFCPQTKRLACGAKNGVIVIHELRTNKSQNVQAHHKPVTACAFSDDGKHFATYCGDESKLSFWQTASSFLGMGHSQVKCIRNMAAPASFPVTTPGGSAAPFKAKIFWISPKAVTLVLPDGKEYRVAMN